MTTTDKNRLEIAACKVRMGALQAIHSGQSGNPGECLSSADLLAYLCFKEINAASQDFPIAAGMALAARYQERDCRIYTLLNAKEGRAGMWQSHYL